MMNTSEKLCLRWNDFQENARSAFGELRGEKDFADVTLACEDGEQVEAHRAILASCSPFFKTLLMRFKRPHQIFFMRGLKSEDLAAILDFIYFGETSVYPENLDSFLALADEFQLRGLTEREGAKKEDGETLSKKIALFQNQLNLESKNPKELGDHEDTTIVLNEHTVNTLDDEISSMIGYSEDGRQERICKICGKVGKVTTVRHHIEANHITGVNHTCDICGKISRLTN